MGDDRRMAGELLRLSTACGVVSEGVNRKKSVCI